MTVPAGTPVAAGALAGVAGTRTFDDEPSALLAHPATSKPAAPTAAAALAQRVIVFVSHAVPASVPAGLSVS
ncbi:MAG: hypothetical protein ABI251_06915 [Mycobacteriaceae bacterium]